MTAEQYLMLSDLKELIENKKYLNQSSDELLETFLQINEACIELEDIINDLSFTKNKDDLNLKPIDTSLKQIYATLMKGIPFIRKELNKRIIDE